MAPEKTGTAVQRQADRGDEETGKGERLLPAQPRGEREGLQTVSLAPYIALVKSGNRGRIVFKCNVKTFPSCSFVQ